MNNTKDYRNFIESYLKEHIIGPGYTKELYEASEDAKGEIIDQKEHRLYISGILKPKDYIDTVSQDDFELDEILENDAENNQEDNAVQENNDNENNTENANIYSEIAEDKSEENISFEHHCGLISCVKEEEKKIIINLKYAIYKDIERETVKLKLGYLYDSMKSLIEYNSEEGAEIRRKLNKNFKEYFDIDEENKNISILDDEIKKLISSNDIKIADNSQYDAADNSQYDAKYLLNKLINSNFRKRSEYTYKYEWDLSKKPKKILLDGDHNVISDKTKALFSLSLQSYQYNGDSNKYIKVLMENESKDKHLCQVEIELKPFSGNLMDYKDPNVDREDEEQKQIEYIYRDVKEYGKGIGCAVEWDKDGKWIKSTFFPSADIRKSANSIDENYCEKLKEKSDNKDNNNSPFDHKKINEACNLKKLSHWDESTDKEYIARLQYFVDSYSQWHEIEKKDAKIEKKDAEIEKKDAENDGATAKAILDKQEELIKRLNDNIKYLQDNQEALKCFRYANTAMLIQMVIARDERFKKNRDKAEVEKLENVFNDLEFFKKFEDYSYRPFQLAFLLMNVRSTMEQEDPYRKDIVDLIWFPTGGGKTEAYLALTALTIIYRKHCEESKAGITAGGVSVIMRYTLRLLTTQQFERASYLICALEFMRNKIDSKTLNLGKRTISIGLWVGSSVTPNRYEELNGNNSKYQTFRDNRNGNNPYPVSYCPWCGSKLFLVGENNQDPIGYLENGNLSCINANCFYNENKGAQIPIKFVDEAIYAQAPTLLFATVDKFAQIYNHASLLGVGKKNLSPDLIIQDELHLISGPLGSMVGIFETAIQYLANSQNGRTPKIIASTATTRNTKELIKKLYNRNVNIFPASGIRYDDNFFSHIEDDSLRRHIGVSSHLASVKSEVKLFAHLLMSRLALMKKYLIDKGVDLANEDDIIKALIDENFHLQSDLDYYWPVVAYYTSLREIGRMRSRISQDISFSIGSAKRYLSIPTTFDRIWKNIGNSRILELTGRVDSGSIKDMLNTAEKKAVFREREQNTENEFRKSLSPTDSSKDIVLATNMISVGIDIARWNIMLMSSFPSSIAEYIQSSSRVARNKEGLVINLFNRRTIRALSIYENYKSFHNSYYKYVEPLSITPDTKSLFSHKIMNNILSCFRKVHNNNAQEAKEKLLEELTARFALNESMKDFVSKFINNMNNMNNMNNNEFMHSLRDIEENVSICIGQINY